MKKADFDWKKTSKYKFDQEATEDRGRFEDLVISHNFTFIS